ncbi:MAG: PKD domain-containing protein [Saprospiraceae bacterium]|nr:PKD domain-containing protein [Saprospiraceae bacterium]MDW8482909.1 PKD domain-containing protein [Saprospiraceae bacterium]
MPCRLLFVCWRLVWILPLFLSAVLNAQTIEGQEQRTIELPQGLRRVLTQWHVYRLSPALLQQRLSETPDHATISLRLGTRYEWTLQLQPSRILAPGYFLQVATDEGVEIHRRLRQIAFRGYEAKSAGKVRLTVDRDFLYGFVEAGGERYYIEPLWYYQFDAPRDLFLVYPMSAVIKESHHDHGECSLLAAEEHEHFVEKRKKEDVPENSGCYEIEIAIASDRSMYDKYGSVGAVEARNIGIINNVQEDYTGVFNHDMDFVIVTQYVVTGTDPWTSSTDPGQLLASFRNWGNNNGFGVPFDNGELWTNRDFDGPTIGIAYLNGMCNSNKYHCLQDFSTNSELLRCLTSHEIGHNMSANHDPVGGGSCPPNYIMCPYVSTTNSWSSNSVNVISNYITNRINAGCFQPCGSNQPPVANFDWSPKPACRLQQVQFTDQSTGNITSRNWIFPGGSPASSTQQNPVVTWNNAGTYNVVLTVSGPGGTSSVTKAVLIKPTPSANFTYTFNGLTYNFTNTSQNATSFNWDFGDGNSSTEENPVHTYAQSGIYTVVLTVQNDCGTATKTVVINTLPTADFSASPTSGCAPLVVQFTNQSSSNATSFIWQFPGGSPVSSNQKNPIVSYQVSGTYSVTLTAINSTGTNQITKTNYITVQNIPSANFTYTVDTLKVTFTNTSQGANSFLWNFGDGNTSTAQNPVHRYAQSGTYTVTLTATNPCGSNTSIKTITVVGPPVANFTATPTSGCSPLTVQFTSTSLGNPTSYAWQFPGGTPNTSSAQNPTVTYNAPGNYDVTLTVTNPYGTHTLTKTNFIQVIPPPTAGFSVTTNGLAASFTNSSTHATSYAWNFGDGNSSTAQNPQHTYAQEGVYTVTLIATGPCGVDTFQRAVTIVTPPTAGFTADTTNGCGPLTVQFTSTSSSNSTSFQWSFPGGTPDTSSAQNPTVTYTSPGTYSVTLIVSNAAGADTLTRTNFITVGPSPISGFTATTNGFTATFNNTSQHANTYVWHFGDGSSSTAQHPEHTYSQDSIYTVTLIASGPCGVDTFEQAITIVTSPKAGFTASPTSGCSPLTVQFTSTSSSNSTSFYWEFPGGTPDTSTAKDPSVTYNAVGIYSVTLIVTNAAGSDTLTRTDFIAVGPPPPVTNFSVDINGAHAAFTNQSVHATTYHWDFGDGNNSTEQSPAHTYTNDGTYTVTLTATGPCGTSTAVQTITIATPPKAGFTASPTADCGPLTVQFTSTSSSNAASFQWSFPSGTPESSTEQNPVVTYASPGAYSVTLIVSNPQGSDTLVRNDFIQVFADATASFVSTVNGASAAFQNTSSNANSFLWHFGDGNTSNEVNPTHIYAEDGTYTVTLIAANSCNADTFSQTIVIITPPKASFIAEPMTGCGPLMVQFTNTSSANATSFLWEFPGGTPPSSTEPNPIVTYEHPGVYSVVLTASNSAGSSTVEQVDFVVVVGLPTASFSAAISSATVNFSNHSNSANAYHWDFGDGTTSTQQNPTHVYAASGTYTVVLTAFNACGTATSTQTITILLPPTAAFSPNPMGGCAPLTVAFLNQSSADATEFNWTFQGGTPATSTEKEPTVVFKEPGVYKITLVASNAAGSSTSEMTIVVEGLPTAGFSVQQIGPNLALTNTSQNASNFYWNFGDGTTSTEMNPTHTYTQPGIYTITLRAENACGSVEFSVQVEIRGTAPTAGFKPSITQGCTPLTVQFTDQSAGNPTAWNWLFLGGNPSASTDRDPVVTYSAPGVYSVTLIVANAYGTDTLTRQALIEVLALPTAAFDYTATNLTVKFNNQSQHGLSYVWNFGDGTTSNEANPTHTYASPGTYTVSLTVLNNCGAATLQKTIVLTSGLHHAAWLKTLTLYPNPSAGRFTVELRGESAPEVAFTLLNTVGDLIHQAKADFAIGELRQPFDLPQLPGGMYTLLIRRGEHVVAVPMVVQY